MPAETQSPPWRFDHLFTPLVVFLGLVAALTEAARSPDPRMVVQAWTFACLHGRDRRLVHVDVCPAARRTTKRGPMPTAWSRPA